MDEQMPVPDDEDRRFGVTEEEALVAAEVAHALESAYVYLTREFDAMSPTDPRWLGLRDVLGKIDEAANTLNVELYCLAPAGWLRGTAEGEAVQAAYRAYLAACTAACAAARINVDGLDDDIPF